MAVIPRLACARFVAGLLSLAAAVPAAAAVDTFDVCAAGCEHGSVAAAVEAAADAPGAALIRVAQGWYLESNIYVNDPVDITIQGGWNADFSARDGDAASTVLDALGTSRVFYLQADGRAMRFTLDGLTLTGGLADSGGALYAYVATFGADPGELRLTLTGNVFHDNHAASGDGGAVAVFHTGSSGEAAASTQVVMTGNRFTDNTATGDGGAVALKAVSSSAAAAGLFGFQVSGNEMSGNTAGDQGGGLTVSITDTVFEQVAGDSFIRANVIAGNEAVRGAGLNLHLDRTAGTLEVGNNIFSANEDTLYGVPAVEIDSVLSGATVELINNTITHNGGVGLQAASTGSGGLVDSFVLGLTNNILSGNLRVTDLQLFEYTDGDLTVNARNNVIESRVADAGVVFNDLGDNLDAAVELGDDFHPLAGGVVVDAAHAAAAPAMDVYGNARDAAPDIGAVEYLGAAGSAVAAMPATWVTRGYHDSAEPLLNSNPRIAKPVALGPWANVGTLQLRIALPRHEEAVDVYAGIYSPRYDDEIYQFAPGPRLRPLSTAGPVKWKDGITEAVDETLFGQVSLDGFPKGRYHLYLWVVPHNRLGTARHAYETHFVVR